MALTWKATATLTPLLIVALAGCSGGNPPTSPYYAAATNYTHQAVHFVVELNGQTLCSLDLPANPYGNDYAALVKNDYHASSGFCDTGRSASDVVDPHPEQGDQTKILWGKATFADSTTASMALETGQIPSGSDSGKLALGNYVSLDPDGSMSTDPVALSPAEAHAGCKC